MQRPSRGERRTGGTARRPAARPSGRTTAVGPGDRRDGQALIFGWGSHLTRAEKQRYRERFVLAGGIFIFAVIAMVIGVGALQQFVLKPRAAVARVNDDTIQRQWYDKNLAYTRFVLDHESQDLRTQFQALVANQQANAAATATAYPPPSGAASASPSASAAASPAPSGSPEATATPSPSRTPSPTFNPQESATVSALTSQFTADQTQLGAAEQQTVENLIDADIMRQDAAKLGISVSNDEVAAQAKRTTDQLGGDAGLKQLFQAAHLSQGDFNQIQYNVVLRDKFQAYFAAHPDQAPAPSPTPLPSPTPVASVVGPEAPTPTATPTPVPTPGSDTLERWLQDQRRTARISRTSFPLPS